MPKRFADIEEMTEPWMSYFLTAFSDLDGERHDPLMPLPWSVVKQYAEEYGFYGLAYQEFKTILRHIDSHVIKLRSRVKPSGKLGDVRNKNEEEGEERRSQLSETGARGGT